eukprot:scaffold22636_cov101-Isochrysis_galbana.AAC.2
MAGMSAAAVTSGAHATRSASNSPTAPAPPNIDSGPSWKCPGPSRSFQAPGVGKVSGASDGGTSIPHASYRIHCTASPCPTALRTCRRGLYGGAEQPSTIVGPESKR